MKILSFFERYKTLLILTFILTIGLFFRLYILYSVPPSPSLDEASIGYNAYSILKTGRDEYGYQFPLLLRAYDDWRPGVYVYLVIPFVQLFGLSTLAVRLPSVMLSMVCIIATYFLVKELFPKKIKVLTKKTIDVDFLALITTFLLAISPWHIYISRLGHEANLGLTSVILALLFFLIAMNQKSLKFLTLSSVFFSLSLYSYQSQKIIVPISLLGLGLIYYKQLFQMKTAAALAFFIFLLLSIPAIIISSSPQALIRFKGTTAFSSENQRYKDHLIKFTEAKNNGNIIGQIIYNRRLTPASIFFTNYISHFNPWWLFTNSGYENHKVPGLGLLYIWELSFIIVGFLFLVLSQIDIKIKLFILLWFFSSPLPASITTEAPHAMRSYTFLPTWQIFSALGIYYVFIYLKNIIIKKVFIVFFLAILLFSITALYSQYFYVFPHEQSSSFQYAFTQAIPFVIDNEKSYDKVVFSNQENLYQSYMFFLFYTKYDPLLYQEQGGTKSGGFAEMHKFGKYEFRPINLSKESNSQKTLFVGNSKDFPQNREAMFTGYYLNHLEGIKIVSIM